MTSAERFRTALEHHKAGRLREAEAEYRQILALDPRHADALHLLGVVAHQTGRHEMAVDYIGRAVSLQADRPAYFSNLGEAFRGAGNPAEARRCFAEALRLNSDFPEAHNNLGNVLRQLGQTAEAATAYQKAIALRPNYAEAHHNLGLVLKESGDIAGALAHFRRVIECQPQSADAHANLAATLLLQGNLPAATDAYRRAVQIAPRNAVYQMNLGTMHQRQGDPRQAIDRYRDALRLNPHLALAHCNLAVALIDCGDTTAAAESLDEALRIEPNLAEAHVTYGNLWQSQKQSERAVASYQKAIQSQGELAAAHFGLGNVYRSLGQLPQAIAAFEQAIRIQPDYAEAHNNLAVIWNDLSRPDDAEEVCRRGIQHAPNHASLHATLAVALHNQARSDEAIAECRQAVALAPKEAAEHSNLLYSLNFSAHYDAPAIFAEHLAWGARHAEPLTARAAPHTNERTPSRRLRIGYLSPFFRQHAVNYFVEPLLAAHDYAQFEIFCYSDVARPDAVTDRLRQGADQWRDITTVTDEHAADVVRRDQIDILVDLTGHIGNNRLLIFARKPAPVQVTYIGYQNTTGMSAMDYRLTDGLADPPGATDAFHTEKLVRLPRSFFCYQPSADCPDVSPLPVERNGYVTFGSFNNVAKITPRTIDAWLRILQQVDRSRLLVLAYRDGNLQQRLHALAAERGIDPQRIELCNKRPHWAYMELLSQADIALDPFPFNGHTTTCDSLWMGVPVVMLRGSAYASRFGASALVNLDLHDWIAESIDEYVAIATAKASELSKLAELRGNLRARMAASPLLDFAGFTRHVEAAYRRMWSDWCERG